MHVPSSVYAILLFAVATPLLLGEPVIAQNHKVPTIVVLVVVQGKQTSSPPSPLQLSTPVL